MAKDKKVIDEVITEPEVEILSTPHDDVLAFIKGNGITHVDAINVRHDKVDVLAIVAHLKGIGAISADHMGRVW